MLAGCGGSQPPIGPSPAGPLCFGCAEHNVTALRVTSAEQLRASPAYRVLYSFNGYATDGAYPEGGLINVNGTLYGTTYGGGQYCHQGGGIGCGTAFSITPSGTETMLHSFGSPGDGVQPAASLLNVKGTLYSTTIHGGANDEGTVFSVTTSGTEAVFYSFKGPPTDGAYPEAGLINVDGTLYGTTPEGGAHYNDGTVFAIAKSGTEGVFYNFKGAPTDGEYPEAGLLNVNGTLYGTTSAGGANRAGGVFAITPSGTETFYSFGPPGSGDGAEPTAGLINVNGTLYGTTAYGGAKNSGTVFSITTSGTETVLYRFKRRRGDGAHPYAGLIYVKGTLYGETLKGGANDDGTVFSVTPSGKETVLYSFKGPQSGDGVYPQGGLIDVKGTLYGTTGGGGANYAYGTVFSLTP